MSVETFLKGMKQVAEREELINTIEKILIEYHSGAIYSTSRAAKLIIELVDKYTVSRILSVRPDLDRD